jgi:hypothetical protein
MFDCNSLFNYFLPVLIILSKNINVLFPQSSQYNCSDDIVRILIYIS